LTILVCNSESEGGKNIAEDIGCTNGTLLGGSTCKGGPYII